MDKKSFEKDVEQYAYGLPFSVTGCSGREDIKNDTPEARDYGVSHGWSFGSVVDIARHFYELGLAGSGVTDGALLIARERMRQIENEGYSVEHDSLHKHDELAFAAACYALPPTFRAGLGGKPEFWPFEDDFWKPCADDRIRELTKSGAFCAAEIDRLKRIEENMKEAGLR